MRVESGQNCGMVDWGAGTYETTAAELEPVARAVIQRARISAGEDVVDLACGTGNAALLAVVPWLVPNAGDGRPVVEGAVVAREVVVHEPGVECGVSGG
jgi:hypothetical protein